MSTDSEYLIGVDLGGTFAKTAVVGTDGRVIHKLSRPTSPERGPDAILRAVADQILDMLNESGVPAGSIKGMGIGAPGPLSHRKGVIYKAANLPGWVNVPVPRVLSELTGFRTVLHNDANAAAYGEYWMEAAKDPAVRDLVLLTLGTGVGSGIILDGKLLQGHFENAGELGHMIVVPDGLPCPCGQRGCLEQYASASSVPRRLIDAIKRGEKSTLSQYSDDPDAIDAEDIEEAAKEGDALAQQIWDETCQFLAIACVNIQHAFNPSVIVLGGGMSQAGPILFDAVQRHFDARRWRLADDTPRIVPATLGNDAGIIGAAVLALAE